MRASLWLALAYLFFFQGLLSPIAALRMEAQAAVFGVVCVTNADGTPGDAADLAPTCDVSCLLRTQGAAAPPPLPLLFDRPALIVAPVDYVVALVAVEPASHGKRPQSQRAPPSA
ncbi:MAG: hypothetical protein IPL88_01545 [Rhizobiales bacterium]|nr:hypothetical protein [Hyphomicrobiales bacterium]